MMLKNLQDVVGNYLAADSVLFVLALSIETQPELVAIRAALSMPLKVVLLTVPLETIHERLSSDSTTGRQVNLHWAGVWLNEGRGVGLEDFEVPDDRSIREVAMVVVARLNWVG